MNRRATSVRVRDYAGPLGILAAGVVGFSLLCSVSAIAMSDLSNIVHVTLEPLNLIDMAANNLNTAAALTQQVVTVFVPTETVPPTGVASLTPQPSDTAVRPSSTPQQPTRTRRPRDIISTTAPTRTSAPAPTNTPVPTATPLPTRTYTPVPTNTPVPTDTPVPPTATDIPPTATDVPPTDTPVPPDTPTDAPVIQISGLTETAFP
jgi:hypothetical protein